MKRSIIALAALALVQCHERPELGEFSCIKEAPGFYCTNDLAGYLNCSETVNIQKNCSNGTKCSCFINTKCTVAESEICKAYPSPPKLSEDFDYTFFYKDALTTPNSVVKNDQTIRIIRNTDLRKLWARTWDMKTLQQTFVVMVPSGNKSLVYSGRYPPQNKSSLAVCRKAVTNTFLTFWPNLNLFLTMKTVGNVQTWEFRVGNRTANETARGEIIDLEVNEAYVIPRKHVAYKNASSISNTTFKETQQLSNYVPIKRASEFFQVLGFCPP